MLDRDLSRLEKRLRRAPDDEAAWLELAHLATRGGAFPGFVRAGAAPRLVELWGRAPGDRTLGELLLPLLELELIRDRGLEPGEWWRTSGRLGDAGDHWFDRGTGLPLHVRHRKSGVELGWVPGGAFFMGSAVYPDESPIHRVELEGFWLGRFPIMVEEYAAYLDVTGREEPEEWEAQLDELERPVVGVDWFEARAFCRWAGGHLPTEAQWERAARGTDGRLFPWGDASPSPRLANYADGTRKLGSWDRHLLVAGAVRGDTSPFGIRDMGGNVSEWCQDWYDAEYYDESPLWDPAGPRTGQLVSVRGNSWYSEPDWGRFRASVRRSREPHERAPWLGLRLARPLLPPGEGERAPPGRSEALTGVAGGPPGPG